MSVPTIAQQCAAVERAALNFRGHVENLAYLAEKGRRPQLEHDMAAAWLPDLQAAAKTMRWLVENEAVIKNRVKEGAHAG